MGLLEQLDPPIRDKQAKEEEPPMPTAPEAIQEPPPPESERAPKAKRPPRPQPPTLSRDTSVQMNIRVPKQLKAELDLERAKLKVEHDLDLSTQDLVGALLYERTRELSSQSKFAKAAREYLAELGGR